MADKVKDNKANIYSKPLVMTVLIFLIGIMIGIWVDTVRTSGIKETISESEIMWEDTRLLNMYIRALGEQHCDAAFDENLAYNDNIYEYGRRVEEKIESTTFTPEAKQEWRRYVLLQFQFWLNSIELKEKCDFDYANVVYISRRENTTNEEDIENKLQSTILLELKEKCGRNMMLIPLTAGDSLETVNLVVRNYDITRFPSVIVNEEKVFEGVTSMEVLGEYLQCP